MHYTNSQKISNFASDSASSVVVSKNNNYIAIGSLKNACVYVYQYRNNSLDYIDTIQHPTHNISCNFAENIAMSDDGLVMYITAHTEYDTGNVYVYKLTTNDKWSLQTEIKPPSPQNKFFGSAISFNNNNLLISDIGLEKCYFYVNNQFKRQFDGGNDNMSFGDNIGLTDTDILITASQDNMVFLYNIEENLKQDQNQTGYITNYQVIVSPINHSANFGCSAVLNNDILLVGAEKAYNKGVVVVYKKQNNNWIYDRLIDSGDHTIYDFGQKLALHEHQVLIAANEGIMYLFDLYTEEFSKYTIDSIGDADYLALNSQIIASNISDSTIQFFLKETKDMVLHQVANTEKSGLSSAQIAGIVLSSIILLLFILAGYFTIKA